jgi:NTE family protein
MSTHADRINMSDRKGRGRQQRPPFECIALLLQGGGALGAYQAGVYEALAEANLQPDWVAGISIGAINSALIVGNPPEARVEKLRRFWTQISAVASPWGGAMPFGSLAWPTANGLLPWDVPAFTRGDAARGLANWMNSARALLSGASGFFAPRMPAAWLEPPGSLEATSYYDTAALKGTLESLVDFDRINAGETRLTVGAVNVRTGNLACFDNTVHTIGPEHIMASGALPPGFSAIEIEGEHYWDGGLVSNTPLQWVLESEPRKDTLAIQVDLWSARGAFPSTLAEVATRQKEIQYSSRTRAGTDRFKYIQKIRNTLGSLIDKLPPDLQDSPELALLRPLGQRKIYNLAHLIYRSRQYEGDSKDYDFSRQSMDDHWRAGYHDALRTLRHPDAFEPATNFEGVQTFDLDRDGHE